MKRILFTFAIILTALYSCKKPATQPGSPYTKQIAGTRTYAHTNYQSFPDPSKSPVITTDTVPLSIEYINDGTIKVKSYTLTYYPASSNDSMCIFYQKMDGDPPPMSVRLSYNSLRNTIEFRVDEFITSGKNYDLYQSL